MLRRQQNGTSHQTGDSHSASGSHPPHPVHDTAPPNRGLAATFHHTHPHHVSPATKIDSCSTYTATTFEAPRLWSKTTPAEVVSRNAGNVGTGISACPDGIHSQSRTGSVPRELEDRHEVQAMLMLTRTTSEAAANVVVAEDVRHATSALKGKSSSSSVKPVADHKSTISAPQSRHGWLTPVPATCMPPRALTPTTKVIANDATRVALRSTAEVHRVTTPNEVLDILRQVEGENTVLNRVVGETWRLPNRSVGKSWKMKHSGTLEDAVLRNMDVEIAIRRSSTTDATPRVSSILQHKKPEYGKSVSSKKHVRIVLAQEVSPEEEAKLADNAAVISTHQDLTSALNEKRMLRIIEQRREKYLLAGTGL
ncbi:hypothetical protein HDU83_004831 [Entophlyctis luteolus]|nr:hypothetical protein HDU83_004831 [Entophlyctis luteolus]